LRDRSRDRHRGRRRDRGHRGHRTSYEPVPQEGAAGRAPPPPATGGGGRGCSLDSMREVFGAVVVIGLVLVAVFVPVAFFPGVTGRLYQQFSLTIAFAVVLSVFNAVTLTPALAALLLDKESHSHGRFFSAFNRAFD